MRPRKKLLIIFMIPLLLLVTSVAGTFFYYYSHPDYAEPHIERVISRSMDMACTIDALSFSLDPLYVGAEKIILDPFEGETGFHLVISDLAADMSLEGRFGRKTLIIDRIKIQKLLLHVSDKSALPAVKIGQGPPSFLSQIIGWAVARFLFRDISLEKASLSDGQITATSGESRMKIKGIRANMNPDHRIVVSCNMVLERPSQGLLFTAPEIHITTQDAISPADPQITGFLEATDATFHNHKIDIEGVKAKATIRYSFEKRRLNFEPIELQFHSLHLKQDPHTQWPSLHVKARMQGSLDIPDRKLNVAELDLNTNDTLHLKGEMDIGVGAQTGFQLKILDGYLLSDRLPALLPGNMIEGATVVMSGLIPFRGEVSGRREEETWNFSGDLQAGLDTNEISYRKDQTKFDAKLSGPIRILGRLPNLALSADLKSDEIRAGLDSKDIILEQVQIEVQKGEMDMEATSFLLPDIRFNSSLLKNIRASMGSEQGRFDLKLLGQDVRLIEFAHMLKLFPVGWRLDALSDLEVSAVKRNAEGWAFTSQILLRDLAFENPDVGYLGEGVSFLLNTEGKLDPEGSQVSLRSTLTMDEGELLLDRFYFDLGSKGFSSYLEGTYDTSIQTLQLSTHRVQLNDILTLTIKGTLHLGTQSPYVDLSVNIPETPLKPIFHHFVLEPFQMEKPFLASLDMEGDISADLNFTGAKSEWIIKGHGRWHEGKLRSEDKCFDFSGIDLHLPVWLRAHNNGDKPEPIRGRLFMQDLNVPILNKQSLELSLKMGPNRLWIEEPVLLEIPGGTIEVGPILCENIISSKRSVVTSLRLDEIDAGSFFSELLPMPVHGTIKGELDIVYFEENALNSSGQIRAQVFEGDVLFSDLGVSGLFSSFPVYRANLSIKDLSLYELTKGTSFGEIEGILQGHIRDLEIACGQPQKFDLLLETVEAEGVEQEISVRAVDNIARIGGGSSPFMGLAGTLAGVFRKFPYSKIGIRASLVNDAFRINGTVKEDGLEYLIKRGGFSGVNVVNQNTNAWISFKDMVNRIERVTSGPVID